MDLEYLRGHAEATATIFVGLGLLVNHRVVKREIQDDFTAKIENSTAKLNVELTAKIDQLAAEMKHDYTNTQRIAHESGGTASKAMKKIPTSQQNPGHVKE